MSTPFLGEIMLISFNFAPKGWAFCNGQLLPINQNDALFSLLGTTYGGNGTTNFALPNLQGRMPVHVGNNFVLGQSGGEELVTLNQGELAAHTHPAQGSATAADQSSPQNNYWANGGANAYNGTANAAMNSASISPVGGGGAHNNLPPYLVLNFVIALQGIFPSQF
jgi:microcystin-dependent protein